MKHILTALILSLFLTASFAAEPATSNNSYKNIATATTTVVKSGTGVLDRIVINTGVAASTIVIYDNTAGSGNIVGSATTTAQTTLHYGCRFLTGLTIVSVGTSDFTVIYR